MNILKTVALSLLVLASFHTRAFPVTIEARLRILDKDSDEKVITKANLDSIKDFILQQGLRETYCNMYNNNPCYRTTSFAFYLNPDTGQANINCDTSKSDFNNLTIRSTNGGRNQYRSVDFTDERDVYVSSSWPSDDLTVGQLRGIVRDALKEILTAMEQGAPNKRLEATGETPSPQP